MVCRIKRQKMYCRCFSTGHTTGDIWHVVHIEVECISSSTVNINREMGATVIHIPGKVIQRGFDELELMHHTPDKPKIGLKVPRVMLAGDFIAPGVLSIASHLKETGKVDVEVETIEAPLTYVLNALEGMGHGGSEYRQAVEEYLQPAYDRLKRHGLSNELIEGLRDLRLNPMFLNRIAEAQPNVTGIGIYDETVLQGMLLGMALPRLADTHYLIGGPGVILAPVHMLVNTGVDFALAGEADYRALELVRIIGTSRKSEGFTELQKRLFRQLPGLYWRDGGRIITPRGDTPKLTEEELNMVRFDYGIVGDLMRKTGLKYMTALLSTSRGCPYHCIHCAKIHGDEYRAWTPERMMGEVDTIHEAADKGVLLKTIDELAFLDDDLLLDRDRIIRFLRMYRAKLYHGKYSLNVQTNIASFFQKGVFDEELLDELAKSNVKVVQMGTEFFTDKGIRQFRKPYNMERVGDVIKKLAEKKIPQVHYVILTNKGTRPLDLLDCIEVIREYNKIPGFSVNVNKGIKVHFGSPEHRRVKKMGMEKKYTQVLVKSEDGKHDLRLMREEADDPVVAKAVEDTKNIPSEYNIHLQGAGEYQYHDVFNKFYRELTENILNNAQEEIMQKPTQERREELVQVVKKAQVMLLNA